MASTGSKSAIHGKRYNDSQTGQDVSAPVVYVVDDDIRARESLDALICEAGWEPLVFASAGEFVSCRRTSSPNCLVLGEGLSDANSLELQLQMAVDRPDMPIIFISGHSDIGTAVRAIKAGAVEFLTKPVAERSLLEAIRSALELSRATQGAATEINELRERHNSLSNRERDVMELVVSGYMNKQVAYMLGISEITVKAHRGRAVHKMKAGSLAELVNIAAKLGIPRREVYRPALQPASFQNQKCLSRDGATGDRLQRVL